MIRFIRTFLQVAVWVPMIFTITSCLNFKSLDENLQDLKDKKVAAVISGCMMQHKVHNLFLPDYDISVMCSTEWQSDSGGDPISFYKSKHIQFVPPGTYEFTGFSASVGDRIIFYEKDKSAPSVLTKFSVQGGEVIYIGHLSVDTRLTKRTIQAINVFETTDAFLLEELQREHLNSNSIIFKKLKRRPVTLRPELKVLRDFVPMLD